MVRGETWSGAAELRPGEIRVHRIVFAASPYLSLRAWLSREEILQADRIKEKKDAERSMHFRGSLRILLGKYCQAPPDQIEIVTEETGKPGLCAKGLERTGIRFNLSHCGDQALAAFTRDAEIGIDLEAIRDDGQLDEIAAAAFPSGAYRNFLGARSSKKAEVFYRLWTTAEAVGKCSGFGWRKPQDLDFWPGTTPGVCEVQSDEARYQVQCFHPFPGYAAALAVALDPGGPVTPLFAFVPQIFCNYF